MMILVHLQGALGTGINITNAGGAGFKSWEVIKVRIEINARLFEKFVLLQTFAFSKVSAIFARAPRTRIST